jgi:glycosyltransferase involved in cell wall biosynthesis
VKLIIATATAPFVYGGATLLVEWLEEALRARGHEVETYGIPVHPDPDTLPAQLVGLRQWDFSGYGDRLIAVRTPSYLVRHHNKVVWFLHHHRPAYDLRRHYPDVANDPSGLEFRRMMFASDEAALAECRSIFVNSEQVGARLRYYNQFDSEVLYPPLGESVKLDAGPIGDTLVYISRLIPHKRQLLAVQAMARTRTDVKLLIAGGVANIEYRDAIRAEIEGSELQHRITFFDEVVTDEVKSDLLSRALGVVYIPLDEDSYGFVGLEAAAAAKPLVTTTDSGGVLELVTDQVGGYVVEPTLDGLAGAFDALYEDRARAAEMGLGLARRVQQLDISWDHVIDRLLA